MIFLADICKSHSDRSNFVAMCKNLDIEMLKSIRITQAGSRTKSYYITKKKYNEIKEKYSKSSRTSESFEFILECIGAKYDSI